MKGYSRHHLPTSLTEGEKNKKGSYYTPEKIIKNSLRAKFGDKTIYDPCCGSGVLIYLDKSWLILEMYMVMTLIMLLKLQK